MPKYNYLFSLAFELESDKAEGDLTPQEIKAALFRRIASLEADEAKGNPQWKEAVLPAEDAFDVEPERPV